MRQPPKGIVNVHASSFILYVVYGFKLSIFINGADPLLISLNRPNDSFE